MRQTETHPESGLNVRVYRLLEAGILTGKYPAGVALTEHELCEDCGASRTPVRAALQRLEQEGLVKLIPNKGAMVVGITEADLVDIYSIRGRLEGLAASMAAQRLTEEDSQRLREILELSDFYIARGTSSRLRDLDSSFHELLYVASGSRILNQTLTDLHHKIGAYRALSLSDPVRMRESVAEHRAILEAVASHDAARAEVLATEHIRRAQQNLLKLIKQENLS